MSGLEQNVVETIKAIRKQIVTWIVVGALTLIGSMVTFYYKTTYKDQRQDERHDNTEKRLKELEDKFATFCVQPQLDSQSLKNLKDGFLEFKNQYKDEMQQMRLQQNTMLDVLLKIEKK